MKTRIYLIICITFLLASNNILAQYPNNFNQKVIGFGEASHGDKGVYEARIKLVEQLVKHDTLPINILVEMQQSATYAIKEYFNDEIDSAQLLYELGFYGLQTDAFLNMLHTCRSEKVRFYGVDMQMNKYSVRQIEKILIKAGVDDSSIFQNIDFLKIDFKLQFSNSKNKDSLRYLLEEQCRELKLKIFKQQKNILKLNNVDWYFEIEMPLEVIHQGLQLSCITDSWKSFQFRDSCMARNVIETEKNTDGRCLFVGANLHISRSERACGSHLSDYYGENYFIICYQFYSGSVLSYSIRDKKSLYIPLSFKAMKKSFPEKLMKNNVVGYCDFSSINDPKLKKIVDNKIYFLDIGGWLREPERRNYQYLIPSKMYDAVYFEKVSETSSRLIKE